MKYLILCFAIFPFLNVRAQSLDVRTIPAELRVNANTIKREEQYVFEVKNISEATLKVHQVITILNENGKNSRHFVQVTNKFITLGDVDVRIYDSVGKQLEKFKKKDMISQGAMEGLVDDGKVNYIDIKIYPYPFTVEFDYTMNYKGSLFYPEYEILSPEQSVENSSYKALVPASLGMHYKAKNIKLLPEIKEDGNYTTYSWAVKNLPAARMEEGTVSAESRYPVILLAPNHFKLDDYEGDMTSWKDFGTWYYKLTRGRDVFPEERVQFFRNLVKDATDDREKARRIYNYLQNNFRYVSIQLGIIGGFRPLPANFTDEKKYGDCKGLSNFMQAALEAVGVKSYQALINASYNKEPVEEDFPCSLFNHVILCVPQDKDSIWLECTSRTTQFGVLGNFTENRNALLITENGGVLVPTPRSKPGDNIISVSTVAKLEENGSAKTTSNIIPTGEYREEINYFLFNKKEDQQQEYLVNRLGFKQPDAFSIKKVPGDADHILLELEIGKLPELMAGSKVFLAARVYNIWPAVLPDAQKRTLDFYFPCPFEKSDSTVYIMPAGYSVDALPPAKDLKCDYAFYKTSYWFDAKQNAVCSSTRLVLTQYKIPADRYAAVKKFFDDVMLDYSQRIVIKRNGPRAF